ncbi:DUF3320 domain-containing protein [Paracoccus sp. MBLB3053]|uniref:DUF3320 domain-containing protein n=1 Tax=Paracoccus aurantius TaxID=3073814 RepID=A0ABU2HWD9_9RHOB|nr:DUF3320 domain-containing protein [Paracoccus sp. MBLB3053]MDS9469037.1 DUF3320 domain-containing protein [Paracoccus sp. MBLB3053]
MQDYLTPIPAYEIPSTDEHLPRLGLTAEIRSKINFASSQNGVSVLRGLRVANHGKAAVRDVTLHLSATPPFLREKSWRLDSVAPGGEIVLTDLDTTLDTAILGGLDEAELGQLHFRLTVEEATIHEASVGIELLARDEWGGLAEMESILAAFVSPNHAQVARLLKEASQLLEASGQAAGIEGYQADDPRRVWMIAGAIWSAATGLGLSYAVPPASFERQGQKIRDPERIVSEGLSTCLDSSLLLAAAYEAAGLNTAILFSQGHAWMGVWLVRKDFGHLIEPDVVAVRKAAVSREFLPIETTLLTKRPSVGFEEAVLAGRDRLSEIWETDFLRAVDISRARAARIRPMASHRPHSDMEAEPEAHSPAALPRPLDLRLLPGELAENAPTTALGRIERWQRKLLDLSLANKLLNFRETRLSIPMLCPDLAALEDQLARGKQFRLLALKDENGLSGRDLSADEARGIESELASDALLRGQIAIPLTADDMTSRLTELYRKARSDVQEGGTNTLFLAAGFLRWKRSDSDSRHYRAPLILMPARLERRSAQSEFRLGQIEDEIRVNATLLEMLKRDFELPIPELEGELPRDESGLDLPRIFEIVRQRVRDVPGFEFVEECAISTFSFSKYLMWKDLVDRADSLRESALVRHLLDSPSEIFSGAATAMPQPSDIDRHHAPGDLLAPMPADSSQLAAVVAAAEGRDFVLIGPPGTGKSQTITNIIADQIGRGRTVLFVAEKAAALDVVQRRLERQGLGSAVLELHSNKADRKAVLQQLGRAWDRASGRDGSDWVRVTADLELSRDQLNAYVTALHQPGTQGFSVFQAIGRAVGGSDPIRLSFSGKDCHDVESWQRLCDLARDLGQRYAIVADLDPKGPLSVLEAQEWSFGWQDGFLSAAQDLRAALTQQADARDALAQALGYEGFPQGSRMLDGLPASRLNRPGVEQAALNDFTCLREAAREFAQQLSECQSARRGLKGQYSDEIIAQIPLDALELQWRDAQTKFWPLSVMAQAKMRKLLQTYASSGGADPATDIAALRRIIPLAAAIKASPLSVLTDFSGETTDLAAMNAALDEAETYLALEADLAAGGFPSERLGPVRSELSAANGGRFAPLLQSLDKANCEVANALLRFSEAGGRVPASPKDLVVLLGEIDALRPRFADWLKWLRIRREAEEAGLGPIVAAVVRGDCPDETGPAFERAYMAWWLKLAIDASPVLRGFAHWEHDALIRRFRELDQAMTDLASAEVIRRLGNDLPARDSVPRRSELGVLRHQLGLQRPTATIRNLIGEMPTTFSRLAPCVLMSPLSVAQYLPPGQAQFDVVIFDEASQISTWDAIGAVARGRQAIIVGDPKQLPPTNFFGRSEASEEEASEIAEFERDMPSILDEVGAAGIPTHRLNWHYRSRDEALIAFSNHNYYDGRLVTFPSPDASGQAVRLHKVTGVYQRGQGRTNPEEARAIVAMIRKRLADWLRLPEDDRPTLGVITFNSQQQGLILDLLDAELKAEPEFEWFFSDDREEPLIVKNLENIQGDERDVMLFSITFGPDLAGKIAMSFGALNNDGGEKRLNVAITRARAELHVFSSITADQIDLGRARARGVRDLKAFLDYAARGAVALAAQDEGSLGGVESPFEAAVRDALALRGWDVHCQIGVSGFRIDLAVRHPDHAGAWLAGIECDGAAYHSAATARDRDRIRQSVLEGLGWKILRIWSTDWFRHPTETAQRVDSALREVLDEDRARRVRDKVAQGNDSAANSSDCLIREASEPVLTIEAEPFAASDMSDPSPERFAASHGAVEDTAPDPEQFFEPDYFPKLLWLVESIVAGSGPMTEAALARRIAQEHGWQRTGARIQARVAETHRFLDATEENGVRFLWSKGRIVERLPFRGMNGRILREISRAEIASLAELRMDEIQHAQDREAELARMLGIARLSQDARAYLRSVIDWMEAQEHAI